MARTRFSSPLLREECVSMQDPLFSPPYKNLNMETVIGNCLDNLKWFILGLCTAHRSKQRKHESYRVSVRKQTLSSSWHTHTLAQIRTLRKTKEKEAKAWEKKPAFPSSHSLTFSLIILYLTSCCLQLHSPPVNCHALIKSATSPRATSESSGGKSQERKLFRCLFFLFLHLLFFLSLLSLKISSTAIPGSSIYHRLCLLSFLKDPSSKEHHSPPAISTYSLWGRARRSKAQQGLQTTKWQALRRRFYVTTQSDKLPKCCLSLKGLWLR